MGLPGKDPGVRRIHIDTDLLHALHDGWTEVARTGLMTELISGGAPVAGLPVAPAAIEAVQVRTAKAIWFFSEL